MSSKSRGGRSYSAGSWSHKPDSSAWPAASLEAISARLGSLSRRAIPDVPQRARAAVLIPLCEHEGKASILFTKRSEQVGTHKGQVSFPGGKREPSDRDAFATALREAYEEVALPPALVRPLGLFHDALAITGVAVTPVVGFVGQLELQQLRPAPSEVHSVFTVPVARLADPMLQRADLDASWRHGLRLVKFTAGPAPIWGLTAYILDHFLREVLLPER